MATPAAPLALTPETIGDRLILALRHLDWGLDELGEATGLPKTTLSRYLRDESAPPPPRLMAIARALGVTPNDLLGFSADSDTLEKRSRQSTPDELPEAA
jgi:transcriptional regulator with XRE-family HTH domain